MVLEHFSEEKYSGLASLTTLSEALAVQLCPEITAMPDYDLAGPVGEWQLQQPRFKQLPELVVFGRDLSTLILELAGRTTEFHISLRIMGKYLDEELGPIPPIYVWEVMPPKIDGLFGCTLTKEGFGFTLYSPAFPDNTFPSKIWPLLEYGAFDLDLLSWYNCNETVPHKEFRTKEENILLDLATKHFFNKIRLANWLAEGLLNSKEVDAAGFWKTA